MSTGVRIFCAALLAAAALVVIGPRLHGRPKVDPPASKRVIHHISSVLNLFKNTAGRFPTTQEGLAALLQKPASLDDKQWDGPYLDKLPVDSWGEPLIYRCPGKKNKEFDLVSKGPDRLENTPDDITN